MSEKGALFFGLRDPVGKMAMVVTPIESLSRTSEHNAFHVRCFARLDRVQTKQMPVLAAVENLLLWRVIACVSTTDHPHVTTMANLKKLEK